MQKVKLVHVPFLDLTDADGTHTGQQEPDQELLCKSKHVLALVATQQGLLLAFVAKKSPLKLATMPDVPHAITVDGTTPEQRVLSFQVLHKGGKIVANWSLRPAHELSCPMITKQDLPVRHVSQSGCTRGKGLEGQADPPSQ